MKQEVEAAYRCYPFWSWNDELEPEELIRQIDWMKDSGVGGFFMHARGGLTTPYLGEKWFECVSACLKRAGELGMEAYAYDENGWPSGFAGGLLLNKEENLARFLTHSMGPFDPKALVCYDVSGECLVRAREGENVLRIYDNASPSNTDICNLEVIRQFIALTHEEYKKHDDGNLRGFFTDEPQYYRWGHPYTWMLIPYFKKHYQADLLDGLGLMFVEKEGYREFRYRYWKAMQDLMLHSFGEQIYTWCDQNGYKLTGHYVEEVCLFGQMWCCAGIMPFYAYEHIPGIDWLSLNPPDWISPKQVGSVAAQLGKKQVISEMYAGSGWDATPRELRRNANLLYWGGVNLMCQHLLPYSETGQKKRDYPCHFSKVNPWVKKKFGEFNDEFGALGKYLSQSEEIVDVAVLQPIRSCYFDYKREEEATGFGISLVGDAFSRLTEELGAAHVSFHYVDETLLAQHGHVEGNRLVMGKCSYGIWALPKVLTMDKTTEALLREFVQNGGKVCLPYGKPTHLEGQPFDYPYLSSSITLEEVKASMPFASSENPNIRVAYRKNEEGEFLFVVNAGKKEKIDFKKEGYSSFRRYNPLTGESKLVPLSLEMEEGESAILFFSQEEAPKSIPHPEIHLGPAFEVEGNPLNRWTLDRVSYSLDGLHYANPHLHTTVFQELLWKRYDGDLYLKYSFQAASLPSICEIEVEEAKGMQVSLNGLALKQIGVSEVEPKLIRYEALPALKLGTNEIIVKMHFFQSKETYYALFGEGVTESLKNIIAYSSSVEPVYLCGDFGVFGSFQKSSRPDVVVGDHFYMAQQKKEIRHLIEDGYPFFYGDIVLSQTLVANETDIDLVIPERFQLVEIEVNGRKVPASMFDARFDLSSYLKKGPNDLRLTLTVSPRNLMGPHHRLPEQEDDFVGPYSFDVQGSKEGCESESHYAFRRTIL